MGVLGIDRYSTNSITCTVLVHYDPRQLTKAQVIEILDSALARGRAAGDARQARWPLADLHGVASPGGGGPVRGRPAVAGGGGLVRLHIDPDLQGSETGALSRKSGSGWTCSTRS